MKKALTLVLLIACIKISAQNVGIGTNNPNSSALLDLNSINKGLLIPRMTFAQRNNIVSPSQGLLIFQTDSTKGMYYYLNQWNLISTSGTTVPGNQINKIIYSKTPSSTGVTEIWTANYDGSNQAKVNITLPSNLEVGGTARLAPGGSKIFFEVYDYSTNESSVKIYSCNLDGSNPIIIIDGISTTSKGLSLEGVY